MKTQEKFILGVALVALFGTVTNFVFFSPIITLLIPLSIFVVNQRKLPVPIAWLYVFLAAFLISTLLYDWSSLFQFGFYRRDGNFIISYAPLFVLPLFHFYYDLGKYLRYFYIFTVGLYGALFLYHIATISDFSSVHTIVFGGLFIAQNAVGGFLAIVAALGFAYWYHRRNKKELFLFLAVLVMLFATYSRGSILGLIMGITAWYLTVTKRFKMLIATITVPIILTVASVMIGYPFFTNVISTQQAVETDIENVSGKSANVLMRIFYTFPRAYYLFEHSPVFGTGVGSYNDRPLELKKVAPLVQYNAQPHNTFSDAHAHHSYLHILGEQGIMGLGLFLVFWISLFFYLVRIRGRPVIRDFLLIAYFTLTFAAFTEHRITTPSNMLPFTIALGLFMIQKVRKQIYVFKKAA